jgi:subtilisin-like proprotein convertase family protein
MLCAAATVEARPQERIPARATPELSTALAEHRAEYPILIGLREPAATSAAPRASHSEARARRLAAQRRILRDHSPDALARPRFHENFPVLSARASRSAVLELTRHPEVAWIALDGTKRLLQAPPQAAQQLIGSDLANTAGFTGAGWSVAVLDTGVDYDIAALGGVGFPNGRVIGGTDTADDDADPRDCDGHGTAVASIVHAVAPEANIVAVKVFRSGNAGSTSCRLEAGQVLAFDSDILQGIDYAVSNRDRYSIAAINLSVGSALSGAGPQGWCDARSPAYAAALNAARAAGIAVVVASGNEARVVSVNEPACLSAAISVGAVYAESSPAVAWNGCEDAPASRDAVACFSNSGPMLSMLAPGAFWSVPTRGAQITAFAGTSAASPAVAGAAALARQARPGASVAEIAALLAMTGRPIEDLRNGVRTPRLDTLGIVRMPPGGLGAWAGGPFPLSDDALSSATLGISGAGGFTSIQAAVQIDHSDPTQLTVTLRGPDGTEARLHDRGAAPGPGLHAVYGLTRAPIDPLQRFFGRPANGTWTLVIEDHRPGATGVLRGFSVRLVPGQPLEKVPSNAEGRVLPVVAHVHGTKLFRSDLRLYNPGPPRTFTLYYVAAPQTGELAPRATFSLGYRGVLALDDVILSEYGFDDSIGGMLLVSDGPGAFMASSRAYSESADGSFGLDIPSFPTSAALAAGGQRAIANGLSKTALLHSNAGFTEVSGAPVTVRMDVVSSEGNLLASRTASAPANGMVLVTDVIRELGLPETPSFRMDYTVTSPAGRIVPFATAVDEVTGDGLFAAATVPHLSAEDRIVTQAAHVTGANGDFFETNLAITNADAAPIRVTVSLIPLQITGPAPSPRVFEIAPGRTLEIPDLLASAFGLSDPSTAAVRVRPDSAARLVVSARTFVRKHGGTFGYFVPSVLASSALSGPLAEAFALQVRHDGKGPVGFRSNFGLVEIAGKPVDVSVRFVNEKSGSSEGSVVIRLEAGGFHQASVAELVGSSPGRSGYLEFTILSGEGRILPYATVVDNRSGDAIYVAAETH